MYAYQSTVFTSSFILQNNSVVCFPVHILISFTTLEQIGINFLHINLIVSMRCTQQTQNQRATANGLATTLMSFFKAFAPAGAGIV